MKSNRLWAAPSALIAMMLTGCVSLLPETAPPAPRYQLTAIAPAEVSNSARVSWSLMVDEPHSNHTIDTVRIPVATAPGKIEFLAGAEWADRAPRLVQSAIIESFENSGRILGVGDNSTLATSDFKLRTELRRVQLNVYSAEPRVEISVYARLINHDGDIVAGRRFDRTQSADKASPEQVANAMNAAFLSLFDDITGWTFVEGNAAGGSTAGS